MRAKVTGRKRNLRVMLLIFSLIGLSGVKRQKKFLDAMLRILEIYFAEK